MGEILQPDDLGSYIRRLEARLDVLERGQQTSMHNLTANISNNSYELDGWYFDSWFDVRIAVATHDSVLIEVPVFVDTGVTGEVRLQAFGVTGAPYTDSYIVTEDDPSGPEACIFRWRIPNLTIGQKVNIQVQGRVTAGAGSIWAYWPAASWIGLVANATDTGVPA